MYHLGRHDLALFIHAAQGLRVDGSVQPEAADNGTVRGAAKAHDQKWSFLGLSISGLEKSISFYSTS